MASTREERMQQRLRGAQKRQVKEVDFGLTFAPVAAPALPAPRLSSPQPELAARASTRTTPGSRGRDGPSNAASTEENMRPAIAYPNTSAKRRKLDSDDPSSSTRSTRSSIHASRRDIYALQDEEQRGPAAVDATNASIEQATELENVVENEQTTEPDESMSVVQQIVTGTPSQIRRHEIIAESPRDAPGSGQRVRMGRDEAATQSLRLQDELQISHSMTAEQEWTGSPTPRRKRKRGDNISDGALPERVRSRRPRADQVNSTLDDVDELSPEQPTRRGRRRNSSVGKQSSGEEIVEDLVEETEEAEEINDKEAAILLKNIRRRKSSRLLPAESSPDLDEQPESTPIITKKRRPRQNSVSSPAQQQQPKKAASKPGTKASKKSAKKDVLSGSPIPITVHRLTKRIPDDEDGSDADILNSEIPYAKRGGVNAIDVLSQVCQEIIGSGLDTLEDGRENSEDSALRREYRNKYRALESFGEELQTRLLEHTINLDNSFSLERRVREEQKKKLAFRDEILRVRAEREQVALRMDEIRIKHEQESKDAQERDSLSTSIHDIELAIERGKEQNAHEPADGLVEMVGIELLLKRIAGEVSNKSDSGGMLKQIKDFNAFLERAALALEARKSGIFV